MNLNNQKIEKYITIEKRDKIIFTSNLRYYKNNNEEYIFCNSSDIANIYHINNDYSLIFSIKEKINKNNEYEIKNGFLFAHKNKLMLLLSFIYKVSIYNINNKQLIITIFKDKRLLFKDAEDYIFVDKNKKVYIIYTRNENITSLVFPKCKPYKTYKNFLPAKGNFSYPRVFEFENNITYLMSIFHNDILYIFDFYNGELIKEIYINVDNTIPQEYFFWNSEALIIPDSGDGIGSIIVNIFGEFIDTFLCNCSNMKKIYLSDTGESLIYRTIYGDIEIVSRRKLNCLKEKKNETNENKKYLYEKFENKNECEYDDNFFDIYNEDN